MIPDQDDKPRSRFFPLAAAAWLILTISGTVLHHALWVSSSALRPESTFIQGLGNTLHTLIGPVWVAVRIVARTWPTGGWIGPLVINAAGWALWIAAFWLLLRIRRSWLDWGKRSASANDPPTSPKPATTQLPAASIFGRPDSGRRRFLIEAPAAAVGFIGSTSLVRGEFVDPWDLSIARHQARIRDLAPALDGLRIVQLSDTHLGPRIPASFIRRAVDLALGLKPGLVALTGDYIHNGTAFIEPAAELFRPLVDSGCPVVAVLGNHDWYGDGEAMRKALEAAGIRTLDNRCLYLDAFSRRLSQSPPAPGSLCLAGVGDLLTDTIDLASALDDVPVDTPRILLAHNPDTAEVIAGRLRLPTDRKGRRRYIPSRLQAPPRIDLMLSGHTHGGQIRLPFLGTPVVPSIRGQEYAGGLVQGPLGPIVISRGVGMSILPIRLGVRPEVVEITLQAR